MPLVQLSYLFLFLYSHARSGFDDDYSETSSSSSSSSSTNSSITNSSGTNSSSSASNLVNNATAINDGNSSSAADLDNTNSSSSASNLVNNATAITDGNSSSAADLDNTNSSSSASNLVTNGTAITDGNSSSPADLDNAKNSKAQFTFKTVREKKRKTYDDFYDDDLDDDDFVKPDDDDDFWLAYLGEDDYMNLMTRKFDDVYHNNDDNYGAQWWDNEGVSYTEIFYTVGEANYLIHQMMEMMRVYFDWISLAPYRQVTVDAIGDDNLYGVHTERRILANATTISKKVPVIAISDGNSLYFYTCLSADNTCNGDGWGSGLEWIETNEMGETINFESLSTLGHSSAGIVIGDPSASKFYCHPHIFNLIIHCRTN